MITTIKITRALLHTSLKAVLLHASKDDSREQLCAVLLEIDGDQLHIVATDGHTLGWARPICQVDGPNTSFLIPLIRVKVLISELKPSQYNAEMVLDVEIGGPVLKINGPDMFLSAPRVEGEFPPFHATVPRKSKHGASDAVALIRINPVYLERMCKSVIAFSGKGAFTNGIQGVNASIHQDALDPLRFDREDLDRGEFTAVVMPMRLD